jgi:hypothetical protein
MVWAWSSGLLLLAAAILAALLLIGHTSGQAAAERCIDWEVSVLLAGIPQQGSTLGQPTAPVTLEFFGDLECLTTKNWVTRLLPAIIKQFVRPGRLKRL